MLENGRSVSPPVRWALLLLVLGMGAVSVYARLPEDLWNDEIYTLQFFVFKGLPTVLTDYHVPNNHVLANVLHWLWATTGGCDIGTFLDEAWKIRLLPGLMSVGTVWLLYRTGSREWGAAGGWAAVIFLLSGITFERFAFQVRGYSLSLLAAAALLGVALGFLEKKANTWRIWLTAAGLSAALLYTIPSNLYFVASVGAMVVLARGWRERAGWVFSAALAAGAVLAVALYAQMLSQVLHNEYLAAGGAFRALHFENAFQTLQQFFSWRWWLLPVLIWGWWRAYREGGLRRQQVLLLSGSLLMPFLLSALRGDEPPLRTFLTGLPALALLAGVCWVALGGGSWRRLLAAMAVTGCLLSFAYARYEARQREARGLDEVVRYQELNYNYYQDFYAPNLELDLFRSKFGSGQPLVLETAEPYDLPIFLAHKKMRFVPLDSIEAQLQQRSTVFVSTRHPRNFIREMQKMPGGWACSYLQPQTRYPRIVICKRTK